MGLGSTPLRPPSGHSTESCNCPSGVMNGGLQLGPAAPGIRVLFWVGFFCIFKCFYHFLRQSAGWFLFPADREQQLHQDGLSR